MTREILREPLLHFLALGIALFVAHAWIARDADTHGTSADGVVRITAQDVAWLAESWTRQRQRPPSDSELRGLIADYVKELLLACEAVALGMDENDTLIRRRLAQKMQFFVQDIARSAEPGDDVLLAYYRAHPERFAASPRLWFRQVFFGGEQATARAATALEALTPTDDLSVLGDRTLLPLEFADEDQATIGRVLGEAFAQRLIELEPNRWHGPIDSSYGTHLVNVTRREMGDHLAFETVRERILEAWYIEQQQIADRLYFAELLKKYNVVVDENLKPLIGDQLGPLVLGQAGGALP